MNGLVGGPLLVECLGLDPPATPLNPALSILEE